jgi:hypothetical protein
MSVDVVQHRAVLTGQCYRMRGSPVDADNRVAVLTPGRQKRFESITQTR